MGIDWRVCCWGMIRDVCMMWMLFSYIFSLLCGVWYLGLLFVCVYVVCVIIGIIVVLLIGDCWLIVCGGECGMIYDIVLWVVFFGLIGGRFYYLVIDWWIYFGDGGVGLVVVL